MDDKLLEMLFGPGLLDSQGEWQDVPEVIRRSFLVVAKELLRLRRLVAANPPDPVLQRGKDSEVLVLEDQLAALTTKLQHAQDEADARYRRTNQKLLSVWEEVAATAQAAAEVQTQHERLAANWEAAETQLQLLMRRMQDQDRKIRANRMQDNRALHELQKSRVLSEQELYRLQRQLTAYNNQVVGITVPKTQDAVQDEKDPGQDGAARVLLHNCYLNALKEKQDGGLSPVPEHG